MTPQQENEFRIQAQCDLNKAELSQDEQVSTNIEGKSENHKEENKS